MPASRRRVDLAATVWRSWALLCPDSHPSVPNPRSNSGSHYTPDHARVGELAKPPRLGSRQCDAWKRSDEMQATASEPPCPHRVRDLLTVTEPGLNGPQSGSRSALWRGVCATGAAGDGHRGDSAVVAGDLEQRARSISVPGIAFRQSDAAGVRARSQPELFWAHRSQQHLKSWISCRQASAR